MIHYFTLKWAKRSVKVLAAIKTGLYKLLNATTVHFFSGKDVTKVKIDATAWQKTTQDRLGEHSKSHSIAQ